MWLKTLKVTFYLFGTIFCLSILKSVLAGSSFSGFTFIVTVISGLTLATYYAVIYVRKMIKESDRPKQ